MTFASWRRPLRSSRWNKNGKGRVTPMIAEMTNHLWQSTVFAIVVGLLTLAFRKNRALFRPILLLPAGIRERLKPRELQAVLAHELCHVWRRDNLTSAIHMIVEAVFWFHPLVWWIGARLIEERERACDEAVLRLGNEPQEYAEGILNVCKSYLESPLWCVSGVTGSSLKKRIQAILTGHIARDLTFAKKF